MKLLNLQIRSRKQRLQGCPWFCKGQRNESTAQFQWNLHQDCSTFQTGHVSSQDWQEHLQIWVPAYGVQEVTVKQSPRPTWRCEKGVSTLSIITPVITHKGLVLVCVTVNNRSDHLLQAGRSHTSIIKFSAWSYSAHQLFYQLWLLAVHNNTWLSTNQLSATTPFTLMCKKDLDLWKATFTIHWK